MNRQADKDKGAIVGYVLLGIIGAAVLAIPFYGLFPLLAVLGALFLLVMVLSIIRS